MRFFITVLLLIFAIGHCFAQKVKNVSGEAVYVQNESDTYKGAINKAIERARTIALEEEFGTYIQQRNQTKTKNGKTDFVSSGLSEVKGIWLGDTKAPEVTKSDDPNTGMPVFRAKVWGRAREIVGAGFDVTARLLRNHTDEMSEDADFVNGDKLYLSFRTPVSGYLAVYSLGEDDMAYRMLPYDKTSISSYPVEADRDYIFFSKEHKNPVELTTKEITRVKMTTKKPIEYNRIYIIFSTNEFIRPSDNDRVSEADITKLRSLPYDDFQKWLLANRDRDAKMILIPKDVTISLK